MSWQGYVDTNLVGTGRVSKAAIIGLKGGVWATSSGFTVSQSLYAATKNYLNSTPSDLETREGMRGHELPPTSTD